MTSLANVHQGGLAVRWCLARPPRASRFVLDKKRSMQRCHYKVTLETPEGVQDIECDAGTYIFDAAEDAGIDLPISCRAGACSSCTGLIKSGTVDQSDQTYLSEEQVEAGYVLTCMAAPTSDCTIATHQERSLY
ncbi:hypothetical protein BSKO_07662 [Bryopsis sp. KO-2023]|nr:hypothetical protein BSKO_07662 [Bryopsis sp. KO-2023]